MIWSFLILCIVFCIFFAVFFFGKEEKCFDQNAHNYNIMKKKFPIGTKWVSSRSYKSILIVCGYHIGQYDCEGSWYEDVLFHKEMHDGRIYQRQRIDIDDCYKLLKRIEE